MKLTEIVVEEGIWRGVIQEASYTTCISMLGTHTTICNFQKLYKVTTETLV